MQVLYSSSNFHPTSRILFSNYIVLCHSPRPLGSFMPQRIDPSSFKFMSAWKHCDQQGKKDGDGPFVWKRNGSEMHCFVWWTDLGRVLKKSILNLLQSFCLHKRFSVIHTLFKLILYWCILLDFFPTLPVIQVGESESRFSTSSF